MVSSTQLRELLLRELLQREELLPLSERAPQRAVAVPLLLLVVVEVPALRRLPVQPLLLAVGQPPQPELVLLHQQAPLLQELPPLAELPQPLHELLALL